MQSDSSSQTGFVQRHVPWLIAGGLLLLYLFTLSRSITYGGLATLATATGWAWQPIYIAPLHFLVTYPIRWLPVGWQLVGLNLLGAICSGLTLALLARSVAILPHDRTRDQRQRERSDYSFLTIRAAWLPPVLAALACGLQLTFWEHAVVSTGEALDLLLFAYVIRCLLEYRLDQRESWLTRLALVYGLGITNNFAMIGFAPALLVALIWIKGLAFFNLRFITRMLVFGLAGLSLYLLLPAIQTLSGSAGQSFWQVLRANLGYQKHLLFSFPRYVVVLVGLTSLLPVLFMGIRWPDSFADISAAGSALTNLMSHVLHAVFLLACLYVVFDPPFSPRKLGGVMGYPLLPFYYLGALSIGYFSGYFLLVFGGTVSKVWQRPSWLRLILNRAIVLAIWVAVVAVPAGLLSKNLPQIQASTALDLSQFGTMAEKVLKQVAPQGAAVLSDDPFRLYSLYAALQQNGDSDKYLLLDTTSLIQPAYHRYLSRKYPQRWPQLPPKALASVLVDSASLVQLMSQLSQSNELYYLHPSFGYYFEQFYLKPRGLVYQLQAYPNNAVSGGALSAEEIQQNDQFWTQTRAGELHSLLERLKRSQLKGEPNAPLAMAAAMYSRAVDFFGVELQKAGHLEKAGEYFQAALELNSNNPSAYVNLDYNRILRAGQRDNPAPSEGVVHRLVPYGGNFDAILGWNGPVDEPNTCFKLAQEFARGRNFRQAAQQLLRVTFFNPDNLLAQMALASMYNQIRMNDQALALVAEVRTQAKTNSLTVAGEMELLQSEAWAYFGRGEFPTAERILLAAQRNYPQRPEPFATLAALYLNQRRVTNAIRVFEEQLQFQPEELGALINYARVKILQEDFERAIPLLTRALTVDSRNLDALLNRAIAYLKSGHLDEAQRDYEALMAMLPQKKVYPVSFGLHEIAWRKKNRKLAIKYANEFKEAAPPGSPEITLVQARLAQLKNGSF